MYLIYKLHRNYGVKHKLSKGYFKIVVCGINVKIPVADRK